MHHEGITRHSSVKCKALDIIRKTTGVNYHYNAVSKTFELVGGVAHSNKKAGSIKFSDYIYYISLI
jgi:hypothetical protein